MKEREDEKEIPLANQHQKTNQNFHITNPSRCHQQTKAAIVNFNNNLIGLVELMNELNQQEVGDLFSSLENLQQTISFVNKYFSEIILKN